MADPVADVLRGLTIRELRVQCRARSINPAGSQDALKQRLGEHMRATGDLTIVPEATTQDQDDGGSQFSKNNYARPGGAQNVGNRITDRPSSRVLAPPGGVSQVVFGDQDAAGGYAPPQYGRRSAPSPDQAPPAGAAPYALQYQQHQRGGGTPPLPPRTSAQRNAAELLGRMGLGDTDAMVAGAAAASPHQGSVPPPAYALPAAGNYSRPPSAGGVAAAMGGGPMHPPPGAPGVPAPGKLPFFMGGEGADYGGGGKPPLPPPGGYRGLSQVSFGDHQLPSYTTQHPAPATPDRTSERAHDVMVESVERVVRPMMLKDLRTQCRARNLSPAGSAEQLKERLGEHMLATADLTLVDGNGAPGLPSGAGPQPAPPSITYSAPVVQQGYMDVGASNNYSRPGGQQNVGNFLTGRNSSRVLAPPGGKTQISFGDDNYQLPGYGPGQAYGSPAQSRASPGSAGGASPYAQGPPSYPPGQPSGLYAGGGMPPAPPPGYYSAPPNAYGQQQAPPPPAAYSTPSMHELGGAGEQRANNNYSRPGGQQNVGNFLTGRNSSRVLAPPGGKSTITFG